MATIECYEVVVRYLVPHDAVEDLDDVVSTALDGVGGNDMNCLSCYEISVKVDGEEHDPTGRLRRVIFTIGHAPSYREGLAVGPGNLFKVGKTEDDYRDAEILRVG